MDGFCEDDDGRSWYLVRFELACDEWAVCLLKPPLGP